MSIAILRHASSKPASGQALWVAATVLSLLAVLAWDLGGGDLWLAARMGGHHGFVARHNWWLNTVLHHWGKVLSWLWLLALLVGVRWPWGFLRRVPRRERAQLVLVALICIAAVTGLKHQSLSSCPWDLREFGAQAAYVSHWQWGVRDGGPGHCFPAGHASAGFAFLGGWFVLRRRVRRVAHRWLLVSLCVGFIFGLGQQWRGAHFLSHTLWSAWLCWMLGAMVDALLRRVWARQRAVAKLNDS